MKSTLLNIFLLLLSMTVVDAADKVGCRYPKHLSQEAKNGESQIAVLSGDRYTVSDGGEFTYYIGVCTEAMDPYPEGADKTGAGVVQSNKNGTFKTIGQYGSADIMAGAKWVMLEYNDGDQYGHHCLGADGQGEKRRARILFICNQDDVDPVVNILGETNNKTESCYYLFEISTSTVCPKQAFITIGLSVGSVLLIVFFSLVAVYLIGGCVYNRFVLGSKGLDQIPNREFWQDFGNLQADGCDLVCRTGKKPRMYKGIGDDQLQDTDDQVITDENLLPM